MTLLQPTLTRSALALALAAAVLTLAGCAGNEVIAPETPQSNDFLNRVGSSCGKLNVGAQPINYMLSAQSSDTYLVDEVSKLSAGLIDPETFADDINGFYPAGNNEPAIRCIVGLL